MEPIKMEEIEGTQPLSADPLVVEEATQEPGCEPYVDEQPSYVPIELVKPWSSDASVLYHCYLIEMKQNFCSEIPVNDIVLCVRSELDCDIANMHFDLEVGRGTLTVNIKPVGEVHLTSEQVVLCRRFQITIFQILMDHKLKSLDKVLERFCPKHNLGTKSIDYLLLPAARIDQKPLIIDWDSVTSVRFPCDEYSKKHVDCSRFLHTKNGMVCACSIQNALVYTPHNSHLYCITGLLDDMNGNSLLKLSKGRELTYKTYYKERRINLHFDQQSLLKGRFIFKLQNYLLKCRPQTEKESSPVELPPELCSIVMSPLSVSNLYSFSIVPSIMHRLESLLLAVNLKKMILDHCGQIVSIPTIKVLEAITAKQCQENFHLESLETLGDSFLKYAASQQVFKTYQNDREGLLSDEKEKIISNRALCKLGCDRKLSGFIRNESFEPKKWSIPGDYSGSSLLNEELPSNKRNIYIKGRRTVKSKDVADVVEALIGAFLLSTGGEKAAIYFMNWIGIRVDFVHIPYTRNFQAQPENLIDVRHLESLLNDYSFRDPSLLVEALTHGSYIGPPTHRCYQRLEFLGDAVLDYAITIYLYKEYPGMSPGIITDMRSCSANNDCYARSAVRAGLHKHILAASDQLRNNIDYTVNNFGKLSMESTFGWESETYYSEVLADIIESLAGAIYIDSGYDTNTVFQSIRPLLDPLVTPETLPLNPVRELNDRCPKRKEHVKSFQNGKATVTVEVEENGVTYKSMKTASNTDTAERLACKEILRSLKETSL